MKLHQNMFLKAKPLLTDHQRSVVDSKEGNFNGNAADTYL